MTPEQTAALVNANVARALIRMNGYIALNKYREMRGETIAYDDGAFLDIIDEEGIGYNAVVLALREAL
jgi:hypothetical protein